MLFCDGRARFVTNSVDLAVWRGAATCSPAANRPTCREQQRSEALDQIGVAGRRRYVCGFLMAPSTGLFAPSVYLPPVSS